MYVSATGQSDVVIAPEWQERYEEYFGGQQATEPAPVEPTEPAPRRPVVRTVPRREPVQPEAVEAAAPISTGWLLAGAAALVVAAGFIIRKVTK